MKKFTLFYFCLFSTLLFSQTEFAPIGTRWTTQYQSIDRFPPFAKHYTQAISEAVKDTIIQNKVCRKVISNDEIFNKFSSIYFFQNAGKIEFYFNGQFYPYFDFSAKIGDVINSSNTESSLKLEVLDIAEEIVNAKSIKKFQVKSLCLPSAPTFWVSEKFGSYYHHPLFFASSICGADFPYMHIKCFEDNEIKNVNFDSIPCDSIRTGLHDIQVTKLIDIKPTIATTFINLTIPYCNPSDLSNLSINDINGCKYLLDDCSFEYINNKVFIAINIGKIPSGLYFIQCGNNKNPNINYLGKFIKSF